MSSTFRLATVQPNGEAVHVVNPPRGFISRPSINSSASVTSDMIPIPNTPRMQAVAAGRLFSKNGNPSWWTSAAAGVTDADPSVRIYARGRNHARQELRSIDAWRDSIAEEFMERDSTTISKVPRMKLLYPNPVEPVCRSPDHFEKKCVNWILTRVPCPARALIDLRIEAPSC